MTDIFTKERRSEIMSLIKGKNTTPERIVFRYLRQKHIYFQRHYRRAPGCPDLALPRKKRAVFIDGDFWHGNGFEERRIRLEAADQYFWIEKIERNMVRDMVNRQELVARGWEIMQVWEHRIRRMSLRVEALSEIEHFLSV